VSIGGTTTYAWTNSDTSIGLAGSGTGNIASFTAANSGTTPVTASIVVTPAFANGGVSCTGPTKTFTITVNPTAQVNQPDSQVICNGSSSSDIIFSTANTGGTTSYNWVNNTSGIGLADSGAGDITAFQAVNNGTAPVVVTITVTPSYNNGSVSCSGPSKSVILTINPTAEVEQSGNQTLCNGSSTLAITFATVSTGGTTTYAWTNNTPAIGLSASGTGNIASFATVNNGAAPVTATVTVTPTFSNAGVSCSGPAKSFTITVNPTAQVNDITSQVICNGSNTTDVIFGSVSNGGTTSFDWTNDLPGIGLPASGTGNIASFTAINTGTSPVTATIVVTPTFANGGVSCTGPTKTFTFKVNPTAEVNAISNQVRCNGSNTAAVTFATANTGATTSYAWTNDTPGIGLAASGTGNIAVFTAINAGTSPIKATIIVQPTLTSNGVSCDGPTESFTITVNPTAQLEATDNQVLCNGSNTTAVTFSTTTNGGTTTYAWTNTTTSIGLAASGTGDIASFTALNTSTAPVVATVVVTPTFANGGVSCTGPSETFTISVNPTAEVDQPASQVLCNGAATTAVTFATQSTGGATTYA
ncbi:MAG: hypothetical protein WCR20_23065, partial [Verrucomicrobiota bacterium]